MMDETNGEEDQSARLGPAGPGMPGSGGGRGPREDGVGRRGGGRGGHGRGPGRGAGSGRGPGGAPGTGRGRGPGKGAGHGRGRADGPFRRGGFRRTAPRQAVLEVMEEADELQSADQVYLNVHERLPGIGIATVYRTLQLLAELGVLARITGDDGKARYRMADGETTAHRVVLVCRRCSRTIALPVRDHTGEDTARGEDITTGEQPEAPGDAVPETIHELVRAVAAGTGFSTEQSAHQLYGLCRECSQNEHTTRG